MARETYRRGSINCYLDRIRGYLIQATPEEAVRQDTVDWLMGDLGFPAERLRTEFNQRRRGASGRSDVIAFAPGADDEFGEALMVVECKRPGVLLDDRVRDQAIRYATPLEAKLIVLTNGEERIAYARRRGEWTRIERVPSWKALLKGERLRWAPEEQFLRWQFRDIATVEAARRTIQEQGLRNWFIGEDSPDALAPFALNLLGLLADGTHPIAVPIRSGDIVVERDLGQRSRSFGNHAGGVWASRYYRSFLVRSARKKSYDVVSLTVLAQAKVTGHALWGTRRGRTMLIAAVDDGASSHISLEMGLDETFVAGGRAMTIAHSGAMTVGRRGAVKRELVREQLAVHGAGDLVRGDKIVLGELPHGVELAWESTAPFVGNVIRYALARDRIRAGLTDAPRMSARVNSQKQVQ